MPSRVCVCDTARTDPAQCKHGESIKLAHLVLNMYYTHTRISPISITIEHHSSASALLPIDSSRLCFIQADCNAHGASGSTQCGRLEAWPAGHREGGAEEDPSVTPNQGHLW